MPDNEMSAEERAEWIASRVLNAMGVELRESIAAHIKDAEAVAQERGRREAEELVAVGRLLALHLSGATPDSNTQNEAEIAQTRKAIQQAIYLLHPFSPHPEGL